MKAASVSEIKQVLKEKPQSELVELCLRLSRFKKENKELLTFLLFEEDDLDAYIRNVKGEIEEGFQEVRTSSLYLAKKTIRKILSITNKYIRYTGSKQAETELLIHFCRELQELKLPLHKSTALENLYNSQVKKVRAAIATMHEDLQYDYLREVENL